MTTNQNKTVCFNSSATGTELVNLVINGEKYIAMPQAGTLNYAIEMQNSINYSLSQMCIINTTEAMEEFGTYIELQEVLGGSPPMACNNGSCQLSIEFRGPKYEVTILESNNQPTPSATTSTTFNNGKYTCINNKTFFNSVCNWCTSTISCHAVVFTAVLKIVIHIM